MTIQDHVLAGQPLDDTAAVTLVDFCAWLRVERGWVVQLVDAGVLEPSGAAPDAWSFPASDLARVRAVARLVDDLGVNLAGAAVILDLLEERRALECRLVQLERMLDE
jgi:chaperone modulatory protein CbpM